MKKLRWVIDQLPGVRPRLASVAIKDGLVPGVMDDIHFMHGDLGPSFLVGSTAASLIYEAYQQGLLPMESQAQPSPALGLVAYLKKADALLAEAEAHHRSRRSVDPFDDWRAMEERFRRHGHPVPNQIDVGLTTVTRHTGGGRDPRPDHICFHWIDHHDVAWLLCRRSGRRQNH